MFETNQADELKLALLLIPKVLKENLAKAAVYIFAYEILDNLVVDRLRDYFGMLGPGCRQPDKKGRWKAGKRYAEEVKARDKDPLVASCFWFQDEGVLTPDDTKFIKEAAEHRNKLAHELLNVLLDPSGQVNEVGLMRLYELVVRVDEWLLVNMEEAPAGAQSLSGMFLRHLIETVFKTGTLQ